MRHQLPAALLSLLSTTAFAADSKEVKPCQIFNPSNGKSYDLNTITVQPLKDHKKAHKDDRGESWHARGYDYETNFTMNFCAPVIENLEDVVGVKEDLWKNVSAFYTHDKKTYSIGYVLGECFWAFTSSIELPYTNPRCKKSSISRTNTPRSETHTELHRRLALRRYQDPPPPPQTHRRR